MKKFLMFLTITAISIVAFATIKGSPFQREVDERFDVIEDLQGVNNGTVATLTMENLETLVNSTDDTVQLASDDAAIVFSLLGSSASDSDASLLLRADLSADNGDDWLVASDGATNSLLFQNDTSGSMVSKLVLSKDAELSGFRSPLVLATATTITSAQCGSTFYNAGAIEMELPEASTVLGCTLTFVVLNATNFTLDPDAGDTIALLTNANGDSLIADAVGESIVLRAVSASQWATVGAEKGTWTDSN